MNEAVSVNEPQLKVLKPRNASLDVFRGLTVVGMIFVNMVSLSGLSKLTESKEFLYEKELNNLGWLKNLYLWIDHANWHNSWNLADFVFPFFLHIVGMSLFFSFKGYKNKENKNKQPFTTNDIIADRLKRFILLFTLGLLLNGTVYSVCKIPEMGIFNFSSVRIMGVLQRIALADFFAAMLILYFPLDESKKMWGIAAGLLVSYWLLLNFVSVPNTPNTVLSFVNDKEFNLAAYIDRLIIPKNRLSEGIYDAEGILSTIPAIASVLIGYCHSHWLNKNEHSNRKKSISMVIFASGLIILGILWGSFFPINKNLWTSSYVLFMAGWAVLIFALLYEVIDVQKIGNAESTKEDDKPRIKAEGPAKIWILPLSWMGLNPLVAFVGSVLMIKVIFKNNVDGCTKEATSIYKHLVTTTFGWAGWGHETVLFALVTVLIWLFLCYLMYQKRLFLKF